ncbi:MAG: hypothetical protein MJ016_04630 [Victivallaceae bacterium]|nr:hypothetical protein [Victivallaceae bacterium]
MSADGNRDFYGFGQAGDFCHQEPICFLHRIADREKMAPKLKIRQSATPDAVRHHFGVGRIDAVWIATIFPRRQTEYGSGLGKTSEKVSVFAEFSRQCLPVTLGVENPIVCDETGKEQRQKFADLEFCSSPVCALVRPACRQQERQR